jgi:hypothetical protein
MTRRRRISGAVKFSLFAFQDIITCVMGIMLLLTLMLCLQIVQNPGVADITHDAQALAELTAASVDLQSSLANLESAVEANSQLFSAGGLIDTDVLRDQMQDARNANKRARRDLKELNQKTDEAKAVTEKLNAFAKSSTANEEADRLSVTITDAKRVLQQLEQGKRVLYSRPPGSNECWLIELSTESDIRAGVIGKKQLPTSFPSVEHCRDWMLSLRARADFLIIIKPETWGLKAPLEKVCQDSDVTYAFDLLPQDKIALDASHGAGF